MEITKVAKRLKEIDLYINSRKGETLLCSNYRAKLLCTTNNQNYFKNHSKTPWYSHRQENAKWSDWRFRKRRRCHRDHIANVIWYANRFLMLSNTRDSGNLRITWEHQCGREISRDHYFTTRKPQPRNVRIYTNTRFKMRKEILQGCILSPSAFKEYLQSSHAKSGLNDTGIVVKLDGKNINKRRYADDSTLLAEIAHNLIGF